MFLAAAAVHDLGKARRNWQAFAGNHGYRPRPRDHPPLAKFKARGNPAMLRIGDTIYRHEFGSMRDAAKDSRVSSLPEGDLRDLALHLTVTHHGFGRPVITAVDELDPMSAESVELARDIALRFTRLQKCYGPWGLAWREALFRSADISASRELDEVVAGTAGNQKDGET